MVKEFVTVHIDEGNLFNSGTVPHFRTVPVFLCGRDALGW